MVVYSFTRLFIYMNNTHTIVPVDLDTVNDCLQMGQFTELTNYFIFLLDRLDGGAGINLLRFPYNSPPVDYGIMTNTNQFKDWVEPFLDRM